MLTKVTKKEKFFKDPRYPDQYTIDLKYINAQRYCDTRDWRRGQTLIQVVLTGLAILGLGYIASFFVTQVSAEDIDTRSQIREERLEICQAAYKESGINKQFLYKQIPAVRCATYMSLIYAYESDFGNSRRCTEDKNCFGMKGNGFDTPAGFLKFETEKEGREYFAKKYFQWHYKKDIRTFIYDWSMTDRTTYVAFMKNRYHGLYQELEKQYLF